ncbi:MAG: hypothetical protein IJW86_01450 [Clostridia bacterium]|nr:hypothetical protein [Clostridia bacterium]
MFAIKKYIVYFPLFCLLNISVTGVAKKEPFYALLSIAYPYIQQTEKFNFALLALNFCLSIIFISTIIRLVHEQLIISNYVLTRVNKNKVFTVNVLRTLKSMSVVFLIKVFCDIILGQLQGCVNLKEAILIWSSLYLTLLIWVMCIYLMLWFHLSVKWTYFYICLLVIAMQYLSAHISVCSLFIVGSGSIESNPAMWLSIKALTAFILAFFYLALTKKYEHINVKNDI